MAEAQAPAAQPGAPVDPFRAYNFKLDIQGITQGHFTECSGLDISVEVIRYREGGSSQVVHQIPGRVEYGGVTLRYGVTASLEAWQWMTNMVNGQADRRQVSIILMATDGTTEVTRWNLSNAWPARFRGVALDALGHEVAVESLTLVYEGIERS